jgi:hypothetical protein
MNERGEARTLAVEVCVNEANAFAYDIHFLSASCARRAICLDVSSGQGLPVWFRRHRVDLLRMSDPVRVRKSAPSDAVESN